MYTKRKLFLSQHAKERLCERHDRLLRRYETEREFDIACYELFDSAVVTNRHVNDTAFMSRLYEKYGYDIRYTFKISGPALFIVAGNTCVTVLDLEQHGTSRQFVGRPKPNYKRQHA